MEPFDIPESPGQTNRRQDARATVGVHVLSEHVYCPRAAVLAWESGEDQGDEEPNLGPRLDSFVDYNEGRFAEELQAARERFYFWLAMMAPAALVVFATCWFRSVLAVVVVSLPMLYFGAMLWDAIIRICDIVREQKYYNAAQSLAVELKPTKDYEINWWSLRKAGFDCEKRTNSLDLFEEHLRGKPWRVLVKDTKYRIPVIRKHKGDRTIQRQHIVRIAAYCRLIKTCEKGEAPFGVIMFAGSYDCVVIPNTEVEQSLLDRALAAAREFLEQYADSEEWPQRPEDNRCARCHFGRPFRYVSGKTETKLGNRQLAPFLTNAVDGQPYHSECGDRFPDQVPPHEKAIRLKIASPHRS